LCPQIHRWGEEERVAAKSLVKELTAQAVVEAHRNIVLSKTMVHKSCGGMKRKDGV